MSQPSDSTPTRSDRGVFFDVGGTLLFPAPEVIGPMVSRFFGKGLPYPTVLEAIEFGSVAMDESLAAGAQEEWWVMFFGSIVSYLGIPWKEQQPVFDRFLTALRTYHREENLWSCVLPETREVLEELAGAGLTLGVISNSDGRVRDQLDQAGLTRHFSFILDSHLVGCEKPAPEIFRLALRKSGLRASQVVYLGDLVRIDALGAQGVGMSALILDPLRRRSQWGGATIASLRELPGWLRKSFR